MDQLTSHTLSSLTLATACFTSLATALVGQGPALDGPGGGFQNQQVTPVAVNRPWCVEAVDIDGDGLLDVLAGAHWEDKIAWCRNLGNATFGPQQLTTIPSGGVYALAAADIDGDGDGDVVLSAGAGVELLVNLGGGAFLAPTPLSPQVFSASKLSLADLDQDGDLDVVAVGSLAGPQWQVVCYENLGGLVFAPPQDLSQGLATQWGLNGLDASDLDGDGDLDVLFCGFEQVAWIENLGGWSFGAVQTLASDFTSFKGVGAADLDGDGDVDVFSISSDTPYQTGWHERLGNGSFAPRQLIVDGAIGGPRDMDIADADGDGDLDVFVIGSGAWNQVSWIENMGGTFALHPLEIGNSQQISGGVAITTADIDGDGAVDVLTASAQDDKVSFYRNWPTTSTYGVACQSSGVALQFAPTSAQGIGVPLSARIVHAPSLSVVALGLSRNSMPGVGALPFDLSSIGMQGCQLLQSSEVFGLATVPGPIPFLNTYWTAAPLPASANGMSVFAQAFALDPNANTLGLLSSNGIAWTVTP